MLQIREDPEALVTLFFKLIFSYSMYHWMNQLVIPLILATIMIVAIVFIVTPVQKVTTVHQSIQAFISTEHDNALISGSGTLSATTGPNSEVVLVTTAAASAINPGIATVTVRNPPPGAASLSVSIRTDTDDAGGADNEIALLTVADNSSGSVTVAFRDGLLVKCLSTPSPCAAGDTLTVVGTMLVRP